MKDKLILIITIVLLSSFVVLPKTEALKLSSVPFAYQFYAIDVREGKIIKRLESLSAAYQAPKGKATAATYTIAGTKSTARLRIIEATFQSDADPATGLLDAASYIGLYKLTVGKSNRTFTMNTDGSSTSMMHLNFTSQDPLSRRITVSGAILPGEYAFVDRTTTETDGKVTVWCFGID
ncbi:MAG: hypothetical protein ABUT20_03140 [Bacteroidota bacterium]